MEKDTKDTIDFSCFGASFPLTLQSASIDANTPLSKQYPEKLEHIMNKLNQTLTSGGENCLFNKLMQVKGVMPTFFNAEGETILQSDALYKILEFSSMNTAFILERLRGLDISINGFKLNGLADPKQQIDKFLQMAEIFADGVHSDKFTEYTINGKDVKGFNKLRTMKEMESAKVRQQQW